MKQVNLSVPSEDMNQRILLYADGIASVAENEVHFQNNSKVFSALCAVNGVFPLIMKNHVYFKKKITQ